MLDWVKQTKESKVPQLMKMAATIMAHRTGILEWYDCHISTGKVEGINNKIKVMKMAKTEHTHPLRAVQSTHF